jgi:hypothetical protein
MKKILFALTLSVSLFTTAAYAGGPYVSSVVVKSFEQEFPGATNVKWDSYEEFTVATFTLLDKTHYAYFNSDGTIRVIADVLSMQQLPESLVKELLTKYSDYTIPGLYLMDENGAHTYFAELKKGEKKVILNSLGKKWSLVSTSRKVF